MPAGAGHYDRHGIWLFGDDDTGPSFSDTLNKLGQSVMDALDDRDDDRAVVTANRTTIGTAVDAWLPFIWNGQTTYGTGLAMPISDTTVTAARPMLVQISARLAITTNQQLALQLSLNGANVSHAVDVRDASGTTWTGVAINTVIPLSTGDRITCLYRLFTGTSAQLLRDQCFLSVTELRSLA